MLSALLDIHLVYLFLFVLECYHFASHVAVLFRVRLLPRKDLVRVRWYFLADTMTVFTVNFIVTDMLRPIAVAQMIQHLFYFFTWEKSTLAKKVVSWSSLDWLSGPHSKRWEWLEILGTTFDTLLHMANACIMGHMLHTVEIFIGIFCVQGLAYLVMYNPKFAWSSPYGIPGWVQRRIKPIEENMM